MNEYISSNEIALFTLVSCVWATICVKSDKQPIKIQTKSFLYCSETMATSTVASPALKTENGASETWGQL